MRKLLACLVLLWVGLANAADNAVTLTTGSGVTMRTTDVGAGVQSSNVILSSTAGAAIYGTAGTANANVLSVQGIVSGTNLPVSVASGADVAQGAVGDAAWVSGNGTTISLLKNIAGGVGGAIPAGTNTIGTVGQLTYPVGATPLTASATGTTGATTATLAGTGGKTTYICGYSIRANATAAATVTNTITGVITATLSSVMWIAPLASGLGVDEQIFSPCIPASGTNQAIAIISGAPGSGGTVSSKGWGYQL